MKISKYLTIVFSHFSIIFSCATICATIFLIVFSIETVNTSLFWQILLLAFAAALFDLLYYIEGWFSRLPLLWQIGLHFIYIYALNLSGCLVFKWFNTGDRLFWSYVTLFSVLVLAAFILISIILHSYEQKQEKLMNKKLNEYKTRKGD